jgi:tRNA threonylcarbamoyladenosine biosynthesis protein TsaB
VILAIDTSTPTCKVWLIDGEKTAAYEWEADRGLADGLIKYLRERMKENDLGWSDVTGIAAYQGPGSFTGLRIGLTVVNTLADTRSLPIVGATGEDWVTAAVRRLENGESDGLVMPLYGREPNITKPRK